MKPYPKREFVAALFILLFPLALLSQSQSDWPKKIEKDDIKVIIYQPQVESLTANRMEARSAVSVTNKDYESPVFGAMWFDCVISTDRDNRMVQLLDMEVSAAKFPDMEDEKIEQLSQFIENEVPQWEIILSLDELLADLDMNETSMELSSGLNNAPPEIIFTTIPSVLIMVDGDPIFQEIEKTPYEKVVNTPFFLVKDTKKGIYYINGGKHWYNSANGAEWKYAEKVPRKLEELASEAMDTWNGGSEDSEIIPAIILRTTPAELLQSNGEPDFAPIEGTSILYMTNTADDILMNIETQEYFVLVAGRWYRSKSLDRGPWSFVEPDQVPAVFSDIPAQSDMGSVRASVAGTREAKEALLENQIPQTAEVDRREAKLEVTYDGKPKFEPVKDTQMKYAVNTDKSVLLIGNRYYCCDNAIWFESGSPTGPWMVSVVVPEPVQEIPPESPVYNVKYVYIYESTPEVVYVGYTPGYVNSYAYHGCVYYGTGYYYNPWYGNYYYPRPVTYGYNVRWNPYTGWGFTYGVSYGWMTVGWGAPYYGYWGPAGYRHGYHYGYHHSYSSGYRAGYYAGSNQGNSGYKPGYGRPTPYGNQNPASNNVYKNRPQGVTRTGDTYYDPKTGNKIAAADRSKPLAQPANRDNNVYTDRNGNVYRKEGDNWNRVDNSVGRPSTGEVRPSTGQPSTGQTRPSTGEVRPSTGQPSTGQTRPSTGEVRPSTGQPSTGQTRPSTGEVRPSTGQPSTGQTRPSTGEVRPSTGQTRPSTGQPSNTYSRPQTTPGQNLNQDFNSRNRGAERSNDYNQNRGSYQYSKPSQSSGSQGVRPSGSPSKQSGTPSKTTATPSRSSGGRSTPSRR